MPFFEDDSDVNVFSPVGSQDISPPPEVSVFQRVKDSFAEINSVGSAIAAEDGLPQGRGASFRDPVDFETFNPIEILQDKDRLDLVDKVTYARSEEEVDAVIRQADKERERDIRRQDGGVLGFTIDMAAGILDPINLIPVGGVAHKTYRGGGSLLEGALKTATVSGVTELGVEASLQSTQIDRSFGEGAANVAGATFLGGVLGGGASFISPNRLKKMGEDVERDLVIPKTEEPDFTEVNSMKVIDEEAPSIDQVKEAYSDSELTGAFGITPGIAKGVTKLPKLFGLDLFDNPMVRRMTSDVAESRELFQELAPTNLATKGTEQGKAVVTPLETEIEVRQATVFEANNVMKDQFTKYRGAENKVGGFIRENTRDVLPGFKNKKLTYAQFDREVGRAMRRGDNHEIPEVAAAAKGYREKVITPLVKEAQELGILPKELDRQTAESYFMRRWDRNKLKSFDEQNKLAKVIQKWLIEKEPTGARTPEQLNHVAHQIVNRLADLPAGRLAYDIDVPGGVGGGKPKADDLSGIFQKQKFLIPDELVEEWLENSASETMTVYAKHAATDISFVKRFGKDNGGDPSAAINMDAQIELLREAYRKKAADAEAAGASKKEIDKIGDAAREAEEDIVTVRDRIQGRFDIPNSPGKVRANRALSLLRDVNFARLLGGVTLSSLPDAPRVVFAKGLTPFFTDALPALTKNFKEINALSKEEARAVGRAINFETSSRLKELNDLTDPLVAQNKLDKVSNAITQTAGNIFLINPWNDFGQNMAGMMVQNSIMKAAMAARKGRLTDTQRAQAAKSGLSEQDLRVIGGQFEKHGKRFDNLSLANSKAWDVTRPEVGDALLKYRVALRNEIDTIIISPGQERPTWLSTNLGKTIGQFQTFGASSFSKTTLLSLQNPGDAGTVASILGQVGFGMLSFYMKLVIAEKAIPDDVETWIFEGIDRSGVLSFVTDKNNRLERLSGNQLGLSPLLGLDGATRYNNVDELSVLLGPTAGAVDSAAEAGMDILTGEMGKDDIRAMRRLMPYQNTWYLRGLFDEVEGQLNDFFGTEKEE